MFLIWNANASAVTPDELGAHHLLMVQGIGRRRDFQADPEGDDFLERLESNREANRTPWGLGVPSFSAARQAKGFDFGKTVDREA